MLIIFGGFGTSSDEEITAEVSAPNDPNESNIEQIQYFEVSSESEDGLPSEQEFSDDIHYMTHSIIKASEKWGHLEITEDRIEEMLAIAKESSYEYRDFYIEILSEWNEGNFSNAVVVHNTIWDARNGTIGRANRTMDYTEQKIYYEENFDKPFEEWDFY